MSDKELLAGYEMLAAFGASVLREHRLLCGKVTAAWLDDQAVKCGVLHEVLASEPCGAVCQCYEYGRDFPLTCLRCPEEVVKALGDVSPSDKAEWCKITELAAERDEARREADAQRNWAVKRDQDYADAVRERDEARREVEALRADAERYRFLRVRHPGNRLEVRYWTGAWWELVEAEQADAAIDAARSTKP